MNKAGICLKVIACLLMAFLSARAGQNPRWAEVKVDTLRVEMVESGEVEAVKSRTVSAPQIWGMDLQIVEMVPEGTVVDSGEVLLQFDASTLQAKLEEKQAELDMRRAEMKRMQVEHQAQIAALEREVEIAKYALELAKVQLEQLQFESEARKEDGQLEVMKAEIALKEAQTRLDAQRIINVSAEKKQRLLILQARGAVNEIQQDLAKLTLRAPISGMVVYHADWDGSKPQVGEKMRPGRGVIDLPDLSRMQVKIKLNEIDIARIKVGQMAKIALEAFPGREYTGTLTAIAQIPERMERGSQVKIFEATLEIAQSDSLLKPGMTAMARVQIATVPEAKILPAGCIFEKNGQPVVYKVGNLKKAIPVQLGLRNDFYYQVEGVAPGEKISWETRDPGASPLGYLAYRQSVFPPDSLQQQYFTEMEQRKLTFDYEAFRNRPPEPPGGAPGGTEAMLKQLGIPSGEMAGKSGKIQLTPEMLKKLKAQMAKGGKRVIKGDSSGAKLQKKPGPLPPGVKIKTFRFSAPGKSSQKQASGKKPVK